MTRTEALHAVNNALDQGAIAEQVLEVLDEALTFTPEVVELSAVCHGVSRVAHGE